jgi:hypothetical protein
MISIAKAVEILIFSSHLLLFFSLLDLLGKAKKKILKLDEDILPNDCEGQARASSANQFLSPYKPVDCEPQEMGKNGDLVCSGCEHIKYTDIK